MRRPNGCATCCGAIHQGLKVRLLWVVPGDQKCSDAANGRFDHVKVIPHAVFIGASGNELLGGFEIRGGFLQILSQCQDLFLERWFLGVRCRIDGLPEILFAAVTQNFGQLLHPSTPRFIHSRSSISTD